MFLNAEKILDKTIRKHLNSFVIDKDFLQYEKFGKAGSFAGKLTDLNIWSRILDSSEIMRLYMCEALDEGPDIVDWKSSQLVPGRDIIVSEELAHPCNEHHENESEIMICDVKLSMEPAMNPLRVCDALGGTMETPTSLKDMETIKKAASHVVVYGSQYLK